MNNEYKICEYAYIHIHIIHNMCIDIHNILHDIIKLTFIKLFFDRNSLLEFLL